MKTDVNVVHNRTLPYKTGYKQLKCRSITYPSRIYNVRLIMCRSDGMVTKYSKRYVHILSEKNVWRLLRNEKLESAVNVVEPGENINLSKWRILFIEFKTSSLRDVGRKILYVNGVNNEWKLHGCIKVVSWNSFFCNSMNTLVNAWKYPLITFICIQKYKLTVFVFQKSYSSMDLERFISLA